MNVIGTDTQCRMPIPYSLSYYDRAVCYTDMRAAMSSMVRLLRKFDRSMYAAHWQHRRLVIALKPLITTSTRV